MAPSADPVGNPRRTLSPKPCSLARPVHTAPGFSVRLVSIDYYMTAPLPGIDVCYSQFQGRSIEQVPVVRVYGSTPGGQKTCLHLHKAFPYFYVPYDDELPQDVAQAMDFVRSLAASVEKAMKVASGAGWKKQHVHSCSLVRAVPFYGFHPAERLFIKLVLYHPQEVARVVTLMESGALMNRKFQPYEAHIPFLLQVMVDYNLSGMSHVHLTRVKFRPPLPEQLLRTSFSKALADLISTYHNPASHVAAEPQKAPGPCSPTERPSSKQSPFLGVYSEAESGYGEMTPTGDENPQANDVKPSGNMVSTPRSPAPLARRASAPGGSPRELSSIFLTPGFKPTSTPETPCAESEVGKKSPMASKAGSESGAQATPGGSGSQGSDRSTPAEQTGPQVFVRGNVPAGWMWGGGALSMGTRLARQSLCELEADATVEDILNRNEVLSIPLEEAGPDLQMVPSLAPIWEDERRRCGSTPSALPPDFERNLLPPTELELALRRAVQRLAADDAEALMKQQEAEEEQAQQNGMEQAGQNRWQSLTQLGREAEQGQVEQEGMEQPGHDRWRLPVQQIDRQGNSQPAGEVEKVEQPQDPGQQSQPGQDMWQMLMQQIERQLEASGVGARDLVEQSQEQRSQSQGMVDAGATTENGQFVRHTIVPLHQQQDENPPLHHVDNSGRKLDPMASDRPVHKQHTSRIGPAASQPRPVSSLQQHAPLSEGNASTQQQQQQRIPANVQAEQETLQPQRQQEEQQYINKQPQTRNQFAQPLSPQQQQQQQQQQQLQYSMHSPDRHTHGVERTTNPDALRHTALQNCRTPEAMQANQTGTPGRPELRLETGRQLDIRECQTPEPVGRVSHRGTPVQPAPGLDLQTVTKMASLGFKTPETRRYSSSRETPGKRGSGSRGRGYSSTPNSRWGSESGEGLLACSQPANRALLDEEDLDILVHGSGSKRRQQEVLERNGKREEESGKDEEEEEERGEVDAVILSQLTQHPKKEEGQQEQELLELIRCLGGYMEDEDSPPSGNWSGRFGDNDNGGQDADVGLDVDVRMDVDVVSQRTASQMARGGISTALQRALSEYEEATQREIDDIMGSLRGEGLRDGGEGGRDQSEAGLTDSWQLRRRDLGTEEGLGLEGSGGAEEGRSEVERNVMEGQDHDRGVRGKQHGWDDSLGEWQAGEDYVAGAGAGLYGRGGDAVEENKGVDESMASWRIPQTDGADDMLDEDAAGTGGIPKRGAEKVTEKANRKRRKADARQEKLPVTGGSGDSNGGSGVAGGTMGRPSWGLLPLVGASGRNIPIRQTGNGGDEAESWKTLSAEPLKRSPDGKTGGSEGMTKSVAVLTHAEGWEGRRLWKRKAEESDVPHSKEEEEGRTKKRSTNTNRKGSEKWKVVQDAAKWEQERRSAMGGESMDSRGGERNVSVRDLMRRQRMRKPKIKMKEAIGLEIANNEKGDLAVGNKKEAENWGRDKEIKGELEGSKVAQQRASRDGKEVPGEQEGRNLQVDDSREEELGGGKHEEVEKGTEQRGGVKADQPLGPEMGFASEPPLRSCLSSRASRQAVKWGKLAMQAKHGLVGDGRDCGGGSNAAEKWNELPAGTCESGMNLVSTSGGSMPLAGLASKKSAREGAWVSKYGEPGVGLHQGRGPAVQSRMDLALMPSGGMPLGGSAGKKDDWEATSKTSHAERGMGLDEGRGLAFRSGTDLVLVPGGGRPFAGSGAGRRAMEAVCHASHGEQSREPDEDNRLVLALKIDPVLVPGGGMPLAAVAPIESTREPVPETSPEETIKGQKAHEGIDGSPERSDSMVDPLLSMEHEDLDLASELGLVLTPPVPQNSRGLSREYEVAALNERLDPTQAGEPGLIGVAVPEVFGGCGNTSAFVGKVDSLASSADERGMCDVKGEKSKVLEADTWQKKMQGGTLHSQRNVAREGQLIGREEEHRGFHDSEAGDEKQALEVKLGSRHNGGDFGHQDMGGNDFGADKGPVNKEEAGLAWTIGSKVKKHLQTHAGIEVEGQEAAATEAGIESKRQVATADRLFQEGTPPSPLPPSVPPSKGSLEEVLQKDRPSPVRMRLVTVEHDKSPGREGASCGPEQNSRQTEGHSAAKASLGDGHLAGTSFQAAGTTIHGEPSPERGPESPSRLPPDQEASAEASLQAGDALLSHAAAEQGTSMELDAMLPAGELKELSESAAAQVPLPGVVPARVLNAAGLVPLTFHKAPPTRAEVEGSWGQYGLQPVDWGGVFYGDAKDVVERPVVLGGMEFKVRSREAHDLPPFRFGNGSRQLAPPDWSIAEGGDPPSTLPSRTNPDGSFSILLSPAHLPPTRSSVAKWLAENAPSGKRAAGEVMSRQRRGAGGGDQVFTMDANTGKLVPLENVASQESRGSGEESQEDQYFERPASPKYDESHILATPMLASPYRPSRRQPTSASPVAPHQLAGQPSSQRYLNGPLERNSELGRGTPGKMQEKLGIRQTSHSEMVTHPVVPGQLTPGAIAQPRKATTNQPDGCDRVPCPKSKSAQSRASMPPPGPRPPRKQPQVAPSETPRMASPAGTISPAEVDPLHLSEGSSSLPTGQPASPRQRFLTATLGHYTRPHQEMPAPGMSPDSSKKEVPQNGLHMRAKEASLGAEKEAGGKSSASCRWRDVSQITPPSPAKVQATPVSQMGFRDTSSDNGQGGQQVTVMSLEVHAASRGDLRPDPRCDAIGCVVICLDDDSPVGEGPSQGKDSGAPIYTTVVLLFDQPQQAPDGATRKKRDGFAGCHVVSLPSELALLSALLTLVRACDPDILVGWEVQGASLGFLAERAAHLGVGLIKSLSRILPPGKASAKSLTLAPGACGSALGRSTTGAPPVGSSGEGQIKDPKAIHGSLSSEGGAMEVGGTGGRGGNGPQGLGSAGGKPADQLRGSVEGFGISIGEGVSLEERSREKNEGTIQQVATGVECLPGKVEGKTVQAGVRGGDMAKAFGHVRGSGSTLGDQGSGRGLEAGQAEGEGLAAQRAPIAVEALGLSEVIVEDEWGRTQGSGIHIPGRIVLNLWRIMRGEVKLPIYTLEAVAEAVLRQRVPRFSWRQLAGWFAAGPAGGRWRCVEHFVDRARLNLRIMEQLDLVNRTSELARVFGIDFFSVFSRGSQFRVESMMLRLCRTQNYLLISPSRLQVAQQPAMQCLPLVMEPESRLYTSPVVVLDFQSLYPSMIIAYNLCFSTCLGRISRANPKKLGVTDLALQPGVMAALGDCLHLLPNGVMYAPPEVRPGVLPRLLQEILSTRIMVKAAMKKLTPSQKVLHRVLNARQFALKLIANVTYGYTAAGFSGRMPCAELADSIVQAGRHTLEAAIALVNSHPTWHARVVYGDTDSMFVLLEGRTRQQAFSIGQEIAAAVSAQNPPPVLLKMEKVYQPCFLLTKKRYVGYSYESPQQAVPTFDAKGIETVRRDSCPAVAKTMERTLRMLFETLDLSQVKAYLQRQWGRILSGRVSVRDFVFAKEVRLGSYSARAPVLPPAAIVASKAMARDPRAEPRYGERVPYVVVHGEPGARLVDLVVDPHELLNAAPALRLHGVYYISKQILPALQRVFGLVGGDLRTWFAEMPRVYRPPASKRPPPLLADRPWGIGRSGGAQGGWEGLFGGGSTREGVQGEGEDGRDCRPGQIGSKLGSGPSHGNGTAGGSLGFASGSGDSGPGNGRVWWMGSHGLGEGRARGGTIEQYYLSRHCAVCGEMTRAAQTVCGRCEEEPQRAAAVLVGRAAKLEREYSHLLAICRHCGGGDGKPGGSIACISLDCPVYYERRKVQTEASAGAAAAAALGLYPQPLY